MRRCEYDSLCNDCFVQKAIVPSPIRNICDEIRQRKSFVKTLYLAIDVRAIECDSRRDASQKANRTRPLIANCYG